MSGGELSASCIYEGTIHHSRAQPRRAFRHPLALCYLDLEELPELLGGRLVSPRPGALRFRRDDYYGARGVALQEAVRDVIQVHTGSRPRGPVRLLTQLRSFGHCFNPVSFYYCFESSGERLAAVLAEVTNTPWGERHAYVLSPGAAAPADPGGALVGSFAKALHVSPFMGMEQTYECRATVPAKQLSVRITSREDRERVFAATLTLRRRELTRAAVRRLSLRYPFATVRVLGLIYMHALGLRLAGARVFAHPQRVSA